MNPDNAPSNSKDMSLSHSSGGDTATVSTQGRPVMPRYVRARVYVCVCACVHRDIDPTVCVRGCMIDAEYSCSTSLHRIVARGLP